jgi:hypothetical protein
MSRVQPAGTLPGTLSTDRHDISAKLNYLPDFLRAQWQDATGAITDGAEIWLTLSSRPWHVGALYTQVMPLDEPAAFAVYCQSRARQKGAAGEFWLRLAGSARKAINMP